ncbi:MAG: hypothetical protein WC423_20105 [Vulcanimicrobiota bacterium]
MKTVTALLCAVMLLVGCATPWPACNERFSEASALRQIADEAKICLDDVGNALLIANGMAIQHAKTHTAWQALDAVGSWITLLQRPGLTLAEFRQAVVTRAAAFPELILITSAFDLQFNSPQVIDPASRDILTTYLRDRVKPILEVRMGLEE